MTTNDKEIKYENAEELEQIWIEGFQVWMDKARGSSDVDEEYKQQQEIYSKFAVAYDDALVLEKYSGPVKMAEKINEMFAENKNIKILDYGCGTGLVADELFKHGFKNITGIDSNEELLEIARKKNIMNKYILGKDVEGFKGLESNTYDIVCSSGVFFLSATHPGTSCFKEICRVIKPNGWFVILTKNAYLELNYIQWKVVEDLETAGVLKSSPIELYEGYRMPFKHETDCKSTAAILKYQIL